MTAPLSRTTLMLDLDTCATAPAFFSLLALMLRRAGAKVLMVASHRLHDSQILALGIGFTDFEVLPRDDYHGAKFAVAMREMQNGRCVLWVDQDFDGWQGGDVNNIEGLVPLNWGALQRQGVKPQPVGQV